MTSQEKLKKEILDLSDGQTWSEALREWNLEAVFWEDDPETCLCGKFPIKELCYLRNRVNGYRALVGNVCVKRFMGLPSGKIFDSLKRVATDEERALNEETVEHAHDKGWITDWEHGFYMGTWRKRTLSERQLAKRVEINRRVMRAIRNARPR